MAETTTKSGYCLGVDLGGAKILAGVFDRSLAGLGAAKITTKAERGPEAVVARIVRCVRDAVDEADLRLEQVSGVGLGIPGAIDLETGTVLFAPNLGWRNLPIKDRLEQALGLPVVLENDCNMAMRGVYTVELKSLPRHAVGLFIGTGIGCGLIIEGKLYGGFHHIAGEVGHMVIDIDGPKCACGNQGCFEALASRTAIFREIALAVQQGQKTCLTEMLGADLQRMRSGDLRRAIRRGDALVARIVKDAAQCIGIATANLINLLNPEVVVLGGGLIEALAEDMMGVIIEVARNKAMAGAMNQVQIMASKLGDHAGIIGGAVLVREQFTTVSWSASS